MSFKGFGIGALEGMPYAAQVALEDLEVQTQGYLDQQHQADGTHGAITAVSLFFGGPWQLDADYVITPSTLTANTNNYNPPNFSTAVIVRLAASGGINLTGMQTPGSTDVTVKLLVNIGAQNIALTNADANSLVGNRFANPGAGTVTLNAGDSAWVIYDPLSARWRPIGL